MVVITLISIRSIVTINHITVGLLRWQQGTRTPTMGCGASAEAARCGRAKTAKYNKEKYVCWNI